MAKCLILMPAYNEEKNIAGVINSILELNLGVDILVIDDGSNDCTAEIAKKLGVKVISLPFNMGYGGAIQTGFKYAVEHDYGSVIQFDSDGQHNPSDIPIMLRFMENCDCDMVIGSRFLGRGNFKVGFSKMILIKFFRLLIKKLAYQNITDPTSGLKGLKKPLFSYFAKMGNYPTDFPDADVIIHMLRIRYAVAEFPADMKERAAGVSMHSGLKPLYYVAKVLLSILVIILRDKFTKTGGGNHGVTC